MRQDKPTIWNLFAPPLANDWVRQSRQGQGIARQAVALLRDFGVTQLGLFRLEIVMGAGNTASEAVAIASGATFECRAKNRIFLHGQPLDAHVYALCPQAESCSRLNSTGLSTVYK